MYLIRPADSSVSLMPVDEDRLADGCMVSTDAISCWKAFNPVD